ncbi:MAG: hypothetical protein Q4A00_05625 [Flavobacteriaceae bacterium]|nr:hypothetical protein [Flavobacteriaceae bacterium]
MSSRKDSVRLKAEAYYIENIEATNKEIAELFKVTEKTIGSWATKYDWENKRWNFNASPTFIKQKLQQEALRVVNGEPPSFSADTIAKIMSAIDKVDKSADPVIIHKILKDLDMYISEIDPAFATECTKYHKQFLQHIIANSD